MDGIADPGARLLIAGLKGEVTQRAYAPERGACVSELMMLLSGDATAAGSPDGTGGIWIPKRHPRAGDPP